MAAMDNCAYSGQSGSTKAAQPPLFLRANSPPTYIEQVFFSNAHLATLEECQGAWRPVVDGLVSQQQGGNESVAA